MAPDTLFAQSQPDQYPKPSSSNRAINLRTLRSQATNFSDQMFAIVRHEVVPNFTYTLFGPASKQFSLKITGRIIDKPKPPVAHYIP